MQFAFCNIRPLRPLRLCAKHIISPCLSKRIAQSLPARVQIDLSAGSVIDSSLSTSPYYVFRKAGEMMRPGPARTWVLIDEREDSINDGWFAVDMGGYDPRSPGSFTMVDYPASYNNGACAFAFTDGHAEIHKWVDPRTVPKLRPGQLIPLGVGSANNRDVEWLQDHSTYRENGGNRE